MRRVDPGVLTPRFPTRKVIRVTTTVTLGNDDDGRRLDRVLRKYLPGLPLSALHRLLRKGAVRIDGRKADASDRVAAGALLTLPIMADARGDDGRERDRSAREETTVPRFRIAYESAHLLIVDKEAGVLSHGPGGLDEAVRAYLEGTLPPSLSFRPGPLHRLDRGTSGLIVFSKSLEGARRFSEAIAARRIGKRYLAVLDGTLPGPEDWEDELSRNEGARRTEAVAEGKRAAARALPLAGDGERTLALIELGTGRTHQIRVQAAARGRPLSGDRKYGGSPLDGSFLLHAYELGDRSVPPASGLLPPMLTAPPPKRFLEYCGARFGGAWREMLAAGLPSARLLDAIMK